MNYLSGKNILLGITGGIAAYKAAELVRLLRADAADVRVVMTPGACEFITPLTLQALSGNPVHTELLDAETESAMGHIELARWADAVLVAPATADCLARLVQGRADDLLTAVVLATEAPVALAPAMNRVMWSDAATQANVKLLEQRRIQLFGPAEGEQACGETGPGRMLEPPALASRLGDLFSSGRLAGRRVLVTAGPTQEALDPVRYLGNRSSGHMGYAIARAAAEAGADVRLVSGPVGLATPQNVQRTDVTSALEMRDAVLAAIADVDIFIAVAAVADYRPVNASDEKLKKSSGNLTLELQPNPDILADVAALQNAPFTVGFAAETHNVDTHAEQKRNAKGVDMIAANQVGADSGFGDVDNALHVFWDGGDRKLARTGKARLARQLVELVCERYEGTLQGQKVVSINAKDSA